MFAKQLLPRVSDNSARIFGFDLSPFLAGGETLFSAGASLMVVVGADVPLALNQNIRFLGSAAINGTTVFQEVIFSDPTQTLVGNVYRLSIGVTTSLGQKPVPWSQFGIDASFLTPPLPSGAPSSSAQIYIIPVPVLKFTIPASGIYAEQDFPTADCGETLLYGFDLSPSLSPGETIASATSGLFLNAGTDAEIEANSNAYSVGTPTISGSVIQQMIAWPTPIVAIYGNSYVLGMTATTSFGQMLPVWTRIAIGTTV